MTVTASSAPARTIPAQYVPTHDMNGSEAFHDDEDEFFEDTDPSVIEPTPALKLVREKHDARIRRRQHCRKKAALKPRNRMLRDVAEQNARSTDNGGEIKKPKLPKEYKLRIRNGEVPSDLHKYHVTRYWKLQIKENKQRKTMAKQPEKIALAIA